MASRDNAIRSAKLLETAEYPVASYRSRAVRPANDGLLVDGTLELFAAPRPLMFTVHVRDVGVETLTLSLEAELSRRELGVRFRGKPAFFDRAIADKVKLSMQITAAATQPADPAV
jgi:polyisoprenoid-binding protein YceI